MITAIEKLDNDFQKLNFVQDLEEKYKHMRSKVMAATVFTTLFICYVLIFDGLTYGKPDVNEIVVGDFLTYWTPIFCTSYLVLQFCSFAALLKERFKWLNNHLEKLAYLSSKHVTIKRKLESSYFFSS